MDQNVTLTPSIQAIALKYQKGPLDDNNNSFKGVLTWVGPKNQGIIGLGTRINTH
jgi:hypothetical protein